MFDILTVDALHEWDLGIVKMLYSFLVDAIVAKDHRLVFEFDKR